MSKAYLILLLALIFICKRTQQQFQRYAFPQIPSIACPEYFQYLQYGSEYIGRLTVPSISSTMELVVYFSQREPLQTNYFGRISLYDDRITTVNRLQNGEAISYRIEFPSSNELPKLTKISVNGQDICVASEYPRPSTRLYLSHKLQSSIQTPRPSFNQFQPQLDDIQTHRPSFNQFQPHLDDNFITVRGNPTNPEFSQPIPTTPVTSQTSQTFRPNPTVASRRTGTQSVQCGKDAGISAFIFGGNQISHGQYPWLTVIYEKSSGLRFLCGGTLLSTRTVISAAHCFKLGGLTANRVVVNVGRYNLEDYSEQNFQTREIESLIVHPEFSTRVFPDADLAILHLQQPVQFTNYIRPICLWAESTDSNLIVGSSGVIAGWGGDESGRIFTPTPKQVDANIVSESDCLRSSQVYSTLTSSRTFCAGNRDGSGPCMGDSGSGLMINRNGRWFLRGIVSGGQTKQQKCDLLEYVVFCDVAKHLTWIKSNTIG